jgi:hypothetical protein
LVIGGLLSAGLHERAILADRTPLTDDPAPIGTLIGPCLLIGGVASQPECPQARSFGLDDTRCGEQK